MKQWESLPHSLLRSSSTPRLTARKIGERSVLVNLLVCLVRSARSSALRFASADLPSRDRRIYGTAYFATNFGSSFVCSSPVTRTVRFDLGERFGCSIARRASPASTAGSSGVDRELS